jgi:hypothetical protein
MRYGILLVRGALEMGSVANESEGRGPREGEGVQVWIRTGVLVIIVESGKGFGYGSKSLMSSLN